MNPELPPIADAADAADSEPPQGAGPVDGEPPSGACSPLLGTTILVVGGGGFGKAFVFPEIRRLGARVVVTDQDPAHPARSLASVFLHVPELADHGRDDLAESAVLAALSAHGIRPDGVVTFWEDNGPLCARLNAALGLRGSDPAGARVAKSKLQTQRELAADPTTADLAVRSVRCGSLDELPAALAAVPLPAILKFEHGCGAVGVELVTTELACREALQRWWKLLVDEGGYPGAGISYGRAFVLTERAVGTEHDVDLVMCGGELQAAFVTDNSPTREPDFLETAAVMPSVAPAAVQDRLVDAAVRTCRRLGLDDGVYNIEMIDVGTGVRIIDVNARMGGFYIRQWVLALWGYDLLEAALRIAIGARAPAGPGAPVGCIVGAMLCGSLHGEPLLARGGFFALEGGSGPGTPVVTRFAAAVPARPEVDEPFANLAVHAADLHAARAGLLARWEALGLDVSHPPLRTFLATF